MGARLRGRTATQRSKNGSEKVLGRVPGKGLRKVLRRGPLPLGFTVRRRVLRRVLSRGSEKGVSGRGRFRIRRFVSKFLQARKRSTNSNFLVWISSTGVGVFHVKGWGPKSSVSPSKPRENMKFCRDILGAPEKFEKKTSVQFLSPIPRGIPFLGSASKKRHTWEHGPGTVFILLSSRSFSERLERSEKAFCVESAWGFPCLFQNQEGTYLGTQGTYHLRLYF